MNFVFQGFLILTTSDLGYHLTKTVHNGHTSHFYNLTYWISNILINWGIPIQHMSKCTKTYWNSYIEGLFMWNVYFNINWLSSNITDLVSMNWSLMEVFVHWLHYCHDPLWYHNESWNINVACTWVISTKGSEHRSDLHWRSRYGDHVKTSHSMA